MKLDQMFIFDYRPETLIRVTGEDAFGFLQGQFSNELRQPPGSVTYGLWLNQKGKVVADSQVVRLGENEFLVVSVSSPAAVIRQRLEAYIVADDVSLTDETAAAYGLTLGGRGGSELIAKAMGVEVQAGQLATSGAMLVFPGRRRRGENFEIIGPKETLADLRHRLVRGGAVEIGLEEVEFGRIAAGIAMIPQDLGPGDLPNEGGLAESAVSYTKGCFLGQEVMARLKSMGQVRRRLLVLRGSGQPPPNQAAVFQREKKVGEIRSTARHGDGFVALGMFSLINLDVTAALSLEPAGPPVLQLCPDE